MDRVPLVVRADARIIQAGRTQYILQHGEWNGTPQITVMRRGPRTGALAEFKAVKYSDLVAEQCNVQHVANITPELYDALIEMGAPTLPTPAVEEPKPAPRKRKVAA
jgi:hypothetical protein